MILKTKARRGKLQGFMRNLVVGCGLVGLWATAWAGPERPISGGPRVVDSSRVSANVTVEMKCVLGTRSNSRIDDALSSMLSALKQTPYSGFKLLDTYKASLSDREETKFRIEGGREVTIELLDHDAKEAQLRIIMKNSSGRQQLDTTVRIRRDRSFIVAGPKVGEDVLILPLTVRY